MSLPQEEGIRIVIASDTHYQAQASSISSALIPQVEYISEIMDAFIYQMATEQPDAVLLCGDLVNNGRLSEHLLFAEKLEKLQEQGVAVFVLPGNHDVDREVTGADFAEIYHAFGFDGAIHRDASSQSYVVQLADPLWIVMLDTNIQEGVEGGAEGMLTTQTLSWLEDVLKEARDAGAAVITASHHNIINTRSKYYPNLQIDRSAEAIEILQEYSVAIHFSGHRHNHNIASVQAVNTLTEITHPMLADYPALFGVATVYPLSREVHYQSSTVDVDGWATDTGVTDQTLLNFTRYSRECRERLSGETIKAVAGSLALPARDQDQVQELLLDISSAYYNGTLVEDREKLLQSRGYRLWVEYGTESRYYPWYTYLLNEMPSSLRSVTVKF